MPLPDKPIQLDVDKLSLVDLMFLDYLREMGPDKNKVESSDMMAMMTGLGRIVLSASDWTSQDLKQIKLPDLQAFFDLIMKRLAEALGVAVSPPPEKPSSSTEPPSETVPPSGPES